MYVISDKGGTKVVIEAHYIMCHNLKYKDTYVLLSENKDIDDYSRKLQYNDEEMKKIRNNIKSKLGLKGGIYRKTIDIRDIKDIYILTNEGLVKADYVNIRDYCEVYDVNGNIYEYPIIVNKNIEYEPGWLYDKFNRPVGCL